MRHLVDMLPNGQQINLIIFQDYIHPVGHLAHDIACHALFYYYLHGRRTFEEMVLNQVTYEGDKDSGTNFKQLFISIASLYGVEPEKMAAFWPQVDAQCLAEGLPLMPDSFEYRFKSIIELH